jgi:ribosomal subunit interface protein
MQVSPRITFRDMEPSPALEAAVREKMDKLARFYDRIIACHVVIEAPHRRHHQGRLYGVRIEITLPGGQVVVSHDRQRNHAHEDVHVALRDAFDAAYRQLEDYRRRQDGEVKTHTLPSAGEVVAVMADKGYGFIRSLDGHEVYFHRNSVLDGAFARLVPGSAVRFVEELGEKGPQASSVRLAGGPGT